MGLAKRTKKTGEWCQKHATFKTEQQIKDVEPWCADKDLKGLPPDSERVKDLLNVVWTHLKATSPDVSTESLERGPVY